VAAQRVLLEYALDDAHQAIETLALSFTQAATNFRVPAARLNMMSILQLLIRHHDVMYAPVFDAAFLSCLLRKHALRRTTRRYYALC
jgi:hypothetical protein